MLGDTDDELGNSDIPPIPIEQEIDKYSNFSTIQHAEVVVDLAIQLAKDQLNSQFSASTSIDGKLATILGFTAVFTALILGTKWHEFILIPMIPALLTVLICLFGLWFGRYKAGPDPKEFYEANFANETIETKQALLSELQAALTQNQDMGTNKSFWLLLSIIGIASTVTAVIILYVCIGGG